MHHTSDAEALSRSQYNEPATAGQRWELLSLSWYSSVPLALLSRYRERQGLTLRYPGFQRHGPGAVQAYVRGSG